MCVGAQAVPFAFHYGTAASIMLNPPLTPDLQEVKAHTRLVTSYTPATGKLTDNFCEFY